MGTLGSPSHLLLFFFFVVSLSLCPLPSRCQAPSKPAPAVAADLAPAPAPAADVCNGIFLSYSITSRTKIHPFLTNAAKQPYSFEATAIVLNSGTTELLSWALLIGFAHQEIIVQINGGVLTNGSDLPYATPQDDPTSFSGYPNTDLLTPIATAGDINEIEATIGLVGTVFGAPPPKIPLPTNLSLDDPAFICPPPSRVSNTSNTITSCCVPNPAYKNTTANDTLLAQTYHPRDSGDITIAYDVIQAYPTSYLALVTIENHDPLGRLDNWRLSWEWMRGEFIYSMKGAYPSLVDPSDCIYGMQGQYYQSLDFSQVLNCQTRPTILDLPLSMANDTNLGHIPYCCRNGTILPPWMDPSQSISAFQVQVFKMPPDLNRTTLYPPQSWTISGIGLTPDYQCNPPVRVSPTLFPNPSGLDSNNSAIASWQVVCNVVQPKGSSPKCCVSFSAYYNESAVPCNTCACGCPASKPGAKTCNATAPALLVRTDALLVPFDNRTATTLAWAELNHFKTPNPLPCPDNCGVSINWHLYTDYTKGWTARITLFNWEDEIFADWFAAIELDKAYAGYQQMYSFNGTAMGNNTIFMQGLQGLNYLVGKTNGTTASDPMVPGKQQSVISFTKKLTPGINVAAGDGFPTKVYFNGEECALPSVIPTGHGSRSAAAGVLSLVLVLAASALLLLEL